MFGQGPYGTLTYNTAVTVYVYGSFSLDHAGDISILANVRYTGKFATDISQEEFFYAMRERLASFVLEQIQTESFQATRQRYGRFDLQINADHHFSASRNRIDFVEFEGEFKPGDEIVIDSKTLNMTINGANALPQMTGDFIDLALGDNVITYTDTASGRTVRLRLTHKDKFV